MAEIWIMGEMLVEIMRPEEGTPLYEAGCFRGPFPSGAPAICIDTAARLGHSAGIIGGVGKDDFGKCLLDRLEKDGVDCSRVLINDRVSTGCAFVTYFEDGSRKFIFHIGNTPAAEAKMPDVEAMRGAGFFHVMGCSVTAKSEFGEEIVKTAKAFSLGVYPVKALDATGAGDSFDGAFLCGLLEGRSLLETAKMASAAAALNTAAFGPMEGNITPETVKAMREQNEIDWKEGAVL